MKIDSKIYYTIYEKKFQYKSCKKIKHFVFIRTSLYIKKIKILQPGTCIAFGTGFKIPAIIKLDMPDPSPSSSSCDISNTWFLDRK